MYSWYEMYCPFCSSKNFFSNGDESDLTQCDIEGVKCHQCKKVWLLETREIAEEDNIFFADGIPSIS